MHGPTAPAGRRLRAEHGYSFPELIVAIAIALIVAAGAGTLLIVAVQGQPRAQERANHIQQGRTAIERIVREVRQAETIFTPTASSFGMLTYVNTPGCGAAGTGGATLCRVSYSCAATECTRTELAADGTGTPAPVLVVAGLSGAEVFSYQGPSGNPTYVGVELVFPQANGEEAFTLADGAALRNHLEGPS